MKNITIFIDESGTLPDPKDRLVVMVAVGVSSPERIDNVIKAVRKGSHFRKLKGEIKYYTVGQKTKTLFFDKISKEKINVFIMTIEKSGRTVHDTPENFAIISSLLLGDVLDFYVQVKEIIFDRHFHRDKDIEEFNQNLRDYLGEALPEIRHVDSKRNKRVNVADMVAGAVFAKETDKDPYFYKKFRKMIINETKLSWAGAKRKVIQKIKNLA
ncbi:MAG: DUF3800 domain-containing protein [Actinobacteria bacterium]|nr:DUF3800 domain-containing protein [Actinomycetota bacterium]